MNKINPAINKFKDKRLESRKQNFQLLDNKNNSKTNNNNYSTNGKAQDEQNGGGGR